MIHEVFQEAMIALFGVLQTLTIAAISAAVKMYWDCKKTKEDLNCAFKRIRHLEHKLLGDDDHDG